MKDIDCEVGRLYKLYHDNIYIRIEQRNERGIIMFNVNKMGGYGQTHNDNNIYEPLSEVEELVFWANFGEAKSKILVEKYGDQIEYKDVDCDEWNSVDSLEENLIYIDFRVKKEPSEIFNTEEGYKVIIKKSTVRIGCTEFNRNALKSVLEDFWNCEGKDQALKGKMVRASRKGILYDGACTSWKSVEMILNALSKINVN